MTSTVPSAARRTRLTVAGVAVGAALVLAAPLAASAHVHVTPEASDAGTSNRLSFSFSHGCEDAPTTALVFDIPAGVDGVTPVLDGAWTISRELGDDGIPTQVTYTAVTPVESGVAAAVSMDVIFASSAAGTDVAFPVLQQCTTGATDWSEVAEAGADAESLEAPAPVVAVGEVVESDGHGHSDAAADDHADEGDHAEAAADSSDPVARWLAGGALVAAIAALGVALLRRRKA
ncbi:YcnI family protein [Microbacterium sp. W1N]|uniref:YcnI family protein n=1 Tax=Microbacterium festucae TaxID=2977531 RepID=UPI0021C0FFA1|nr:YcnI family protein [Microbacterium festucae]MCT9821579.1 YcnI family protein [Microbacterium festucae]